MPCNFGQFCSSQISCSMQAVTIMKMAGNGNAWGLVRGMYKRDHGSVKREVVFNCSLINPPRQLLQAACSGECLLMKVPCISGSLGVNASLPTPGSTAVELRVASC